ncbi:MAG TPA: hypothetical protein VI893_06685, partial [Thermoplasmata archaeon]|nr:hypothetical protein [Thermoplasmata archaeon]
IIVPAGIALAAKLVPKELMDEYREKVRKEMRLKKSWKAGAVIVGIWLVLLALFGWFLWTIIFSH